MSYYDDIKEKKAPFESYYISAYGLAVKHGYQGSEEEWLESLSDYGIAKKHGFTGSEEEWNDAVNTAREAAEAAQKAAEAAQKAAYSEAEYVGKALNYIIELESSIDADASAADLAKMQAFVYASKASDYSDIAKDAAERAAAMLVNTGDIDAALDAILDIQANLTGMADVELPGREDE